MKDKNEVLELKQAKGDLESQASAKLPMLSLILSMMIAVVLTVVLLGGAALWLVRSGRLGGLGATKEQEVLKNEIPKSRMVVLDPLLVNLADEGGGAYLRVAVTLKIEDQLVAKGEKPKEEPAKGKPVNENDAAMRDAALGILGDETGAALLAPDGKGRLKDKLLLAFKKQLPGVKVTDVLFTEFLVQR